MDPMATDFGFAPATAGTPSKRCRQCGAWLHPGMTRQVGLWPCRTHPAPLVGSAQSRHGQRHGCCGLAVGLEPRLALRLGLHRRDLLGCTPCDHDFCPARPGRPSHANDDDDGGDSDADLDETEPMPAQTVLPQGDAARQAVAQTMSNTQADALSDNDELKEPTRVALWTAYARPSTAAALDTATRTRVQETTGKIWTAAEAQRNSIGGSRTFRRRQPDEVEDMNAAELALVETLEDARVYAMRHHAIPVVLDVVNLVAPRPDAFVVARIDAAMRALYNGAPPPM
jgi:hypothetical protein